MKSRFKKILRKCVRSLFFVRSGETILDAINRHTKKIEKIVYIEKFDEKDLTNKLRDLEIKEGDIVLVHAAWRSFYNFKGNPQKIIKILEDLVGESGTLLMPSYGSEKHYFDLEKTPSNAGVISEIFRKDPYSSRSECAHFSFSAKGEFSDYLLKDHYSSEYTFDSKSPLYKLTTLENSKILFMGLGKSPFKVTMFHCAGYILKDRISFYKDIYTEMQDTTVVNGDVEIKKTMVKRSSKYGNDNKNFIKILNSLKSKKNDRLSNLDLVVIDAEEALEKAKEMALKGVYCYKKI